MSLWGPAAEAEIEYRQAEARKAWRSKRTDRSDRSGRAERSERAERRPERTQQIKEGIAGMRPETSSRHGLYA